MAFDPSKLPNLAGKVFIVTGGNTGIGYHTVLNLAQHNAKVYLCCRSTLKGNAAIAAIKEQYAYAKVELLEMDHLSLVTVVTAASTFLSLETQLHGLINNAGIMMNSTSGTITTDHHEAEWQTNYLAHWVFTQHLLPILLETSKTLPPGSVRIVNVSSNGHATSIPKGGINLDDPDLKGSNSMSHYGQSKLANILHAKTLTFKYGPYSSSAKSGSGEIWTASLHPGLIQTQLLSQVSNPIPRFFLRLMKLRENIGPDKGCYTLLFTAASPDMKHEQSGAYFEGPGVGKTGSESSFAKDRRLAEKLEEWTSKEMEKEGWTKAES